jgi:phenylpropionate dioxygenase-like ring-hydroxylating dioxygenase large terminal subunit
MTAAAQSVEIRSLLRLDEGFVHSDVYTSPVIFEREIEQIFHRGWVYVGHDSEVPNGGDYVLRWIGRQSVIMNRDSHGNVNLFMNRCRHRANSVCQFEQGNSAYFRCAYHGWTYKNSGELVGVPFAEGAYEPELPKDDFALVRAPRMGSYRGFVWGSLEPHGPSLDDHLGTSAKRAIDLFCDHSPVGEIEVRHGANKSVIYANWKFQGGDGYHPPFTHQADFGSIRAQRLGRPNALLGMIKKDTTLQRDLGNGHFCLDIRTMGRGPLPDEPWAKEYLQSMIESYGAERAKFIMDSGGPHTILVPNIQLLNPDLRVLRPIAADQFEITFYCAFLKGVPKEVNTARVRLTESRMGPAGSVNVDDVEMFERNQLGMQQMVDPWKFIGRGMSREHIDHDETSPPEYRFENSRAAHYSDELTQRAQLRWWAGQMERA